MVATTRRKRDVIDGAAARGTSRLAVGAQATLNVGSRPSGKVEQAQRFQHSGTKMGSVRPNGVVNKLAHSIVMRWAGNAMKATAQGAKNALDHASQT